MRGTGRRCRDESGSAIVLLVVSLGTVMAAAALVLDVGMLLSARQEAQSAADAAALAAASAFLDGASSPAAAARERAIRFAAENAIRGEAIAPGEVAVEADPLTGRVRVRIRRTFEGVWFARILGRESFTIGAEAAAEASEPAATTCVRPFAPAAPSASSGNGRGNGGSNGNGRGTGGGGTPSGDRDFTRGERIPLWSTGDPREAVFWDMPDQAGWSGSCDAPGIGGNGRGPAVRRNICMCNNTPVDTLSTYRRMNGAMVGNVRHGFDGLLDQDPGARWDPARNAVVGSAYPDWRRSPRVVVLPVLRPGSSGNNVRFEGFITVFVEPSGGNSYYGRFVSELRTLRLVQ